jgi:flagellar basal-body rod modification protein FlgD
MDVTAPLHAVTGVQRTPTRTGNDRTVGKDEFLKLFTTQLRYQNPLSPMDSTDFTSQLAQFSSLEQLQGINGQLQQLLAQQGVTQAAFSTGVLGKQVKFAGDRVNLKGTAEITYVLPADASGARITFIDGSGKPVREIVRGQEKAGQHTFTWDGKDGAGRALPEGLYTFRVEAFDASGTPIQVSAMSAGTVTGVSLVDNEVELTVDDQMTTRLGDIFQILGGGS